MSDFNLEWLEENFHNKKITFYNVGCADLTNDSLRFHVTLPTAMVYSFECAEFWREQNFIKSKNYQLHYLHKAVSHCDSKVTFHTGKWEYDGTLTKQLDTIYSEHEVESITINTFCKFNPRPNILHIDAEGEEFNIIRNVLPKNMPEVIWLENNEYYNDENFYPTIPYAHLYNFLTQKNYTAIKCQYDTLFLCNNLKLTQYQPLQYSEAYWTEHEKKIQQRIWKIRYNLCKADHWPDITNIQDFSNLPQEVQDECVNNFNLLPDQRFFG